MNLPHSDYRKTHIRTPRELYQGLDSLVYGFTGSARRLPMTVISFKMEALKISETAQTLKSMPSRILTEKMNELKRSFRRAKTGWQKLVPEALGLIVEAADRAVGLRPYPEQVMGALAMHRGYLAEMATGEGKSLTACLPAVLAAWTGKPCHIVTVNDYLAARDAVEMRKLYSMCQVTVGDVTSEMPPEERQKNYDKGVVYTTSKELVADFLRDRLRLGMLSHPSRRLIRKMLMPDVERNDGLVQRGLHTVLVDEADSVLIDEAVTPLIISRARENKPLEKASLAADGVVQQFSAGEDYIVDLKYKEIRLTEKAKVKLAASAGALPGIWRGETRRTELVLQALTAREFYHLDKQYIIDDGKVVIVDEFTGRLMPNRTWRQGLHQAVEAKEGLEVSHPSETLARLSFQKFFRFFEKISGMTGTAREAANEFWHIYGLPVVTIPTHEPCIRKMAPDRVFADSWQKLNAVLEDVKNIHNQGRPVLIGTRSVKVSEQLADMFSRAHLSYNLLNAIRHSEEARIVAAAGEQNRITIATNMAGRGTDIKLGRGVADLGGLHVIATERHESGRIDRQLFGRCARQGDPGSAQAFMSTEDELTERFVPAQMRTRLAKTIDKNWAGSRKLAQKTVIYAQKAAQRMAYKQRKNVLKMDNWLEEALSFSGPGLKF